MKTCFLFCILCYLHNHTLISYFSFFKFLFEWSLKNCHFDCVFKTFIQGTSAKNFCHAFSRFFLLRLCVVCVWCVCLCVCVCAWALIESIQIFGNHSNSFGSVQTFGKCLIPIYKKMINVI